VDDAGAFGIETGGIGAEPGEPPRGDARTFVARGAMDGEACGLVDDSEGTVLVQDREVEGYVRRGVLDGRDGELDAGPRFDLT